MPAPQQGVGSALLAAAMSLPMLGLAHAESAPERGLIGLKYLDYLDSQPDDPRIRVKAPALTVVAPVAREWSVGGTVTADSISGASPAFHSYGLTKMRDYRRALEADVTHYLPNGTLSVGANVSSEADYLSRGLVFQASRSSEDRNTTWNAGLALSRDAINPTNEAVVDESKNVTKVLLGVTQVLTPQDIVQANLSLARGRGYHSDPYKIFDERPRERNSVVLLVRWNHHIESTQGTVRSSYRYYSDSWRIRAHTLGVEYVQPLPHGWTVTPLLRLYTQSAARFYVDADPSLLPFVPEPPLDAVYYSEDQRVSAFGAHTFGLKLAKQLDADWQVDVKFERYAQRAAWRLFGTGSPGLLPFNARSIQVGVSRQF